MSGRPGGNRCWRKSATIISPAKRTMRSSSDTTLIVVASEFGRPAQFDAGGGRGHHGKNFTVALAGGGLRTGQAIGQTDDLAMSIVSRPISVPDLHATIHAALGIDSHENLYA